jgi:hypothetical protein
MRQSIIHRLVFHIPFPSCLVRALEPSLQSYIYIHIHHLLRACESLVPALLNARSHPRQTINMVSQHIVNGRVALRRYSKNRGRGGWNELSSIVHIYLHFTRQSCRSRAILCKAESNRYVHQLASNLRCRTGPRWQRSQLTTRQGQLW